MKKSRIQFSYIRTFSFHMSTPFLETILVCLDLGPDSESGSANPKNKSGYNPDSDSNPDPKQC